MKTAIKIFIFIFITGMIFNSCREKEEYPVIPDLEFSNFIKLVHPDGYDTLGILLVSYTDGDGDLGISQFDTTAYNFFVAYYVMDHGLLEPGTIYNNETGEFDPINFNNRFGPLAPDGYEGWIKGEIEDTIKPLFDPRSNKEYDTIQFRVHMIDRAGNSSDTILTPLIIVKNP
ncbi:MAG: hypothetical protein K9H16_15945 [Bacteroidales bacterium]|nr:hypothetical protein [Bacteroidales bacterium]